MSEQKTLMFIGAHPDDESFGMGAILAHYSGIGVKVFYLCATRGEAGTIDAEYLRGYSNPGDLRWAELTCAAKVLGLAEIIHLGYRDSGMSGSEDNRHPQALVMAPVEEIAGRMVKVIRDLKPEIIITHGPSGDYGHPDHMATHNAAVRAFYAAGDCKQYPEARPAFEPHKLYFSIRPHSLLKIMTRLMPLWGRNPHKFGRNKDIDLSLIAKENYPIHAAVRISKKDSEIQRRAAACHASQGGAGPPRRGMFDLMNTLYGIWGFFFGRREYFMRAHPTPEGKHRESDLFEKLKAARIG
jgi:N-acetyl-1-D-myo-inositol-2-amino-2-deoxy-alpha-D-glucopyranoside deacetylase